MGIPGKSQSGRALPKIHAFELWCWGTLESPLDCKEIKPVNPKGNQPWIFIGRTDAEGEAPIFWPSEGADSLEKTLMLGKIEGRRGQQRMKWLDVIFNSMDVSLSKLREMMEDRGPWCTAVHRVTKSQTGVSDWTARAYAGDQPQQSPGIPSRWTASVNEWHREAKLRWVRPITLFSKGAFIPWLVHRRKWKMQGHAETAQTLQ